MKQWLKPALFMAVLQGVKAYDVVPLQEAALVPRQETNTTASYVNWLVPDDYWLNNVFDTVTYAWNTFIPGYTVEMNVVGLTIYTLMIMTIAFLIGVKLTQRDFVRATIKLFDEYHDKQERQLAEYNKRHFEAHQEFSFGRFFSES